LKGAKTSLGVVANRDSPLAEEYAADPAAFYDRHIRSAPFIGERLADAKRVTEFRPPKRGSDTTVLEGYHYSTTRMVGDGWVLVGDASGFVDPVLSAGLCIAQTSAARLADLILRSDEIADLSAERLEAYQRWFVREFGEIWGALQQLATDYFRPEFMNELLHRANDDPNFGDLLTYGFIAYDREALRTFSTMSRELFTEVRGPLHPAAR
jgi:flavin-dependent dehydrogenase